MYYLLTEARIRYSWTGVPDNQYQLLDVGAGNQAQTICKEQQVLLTAEPSLAFYEVILKYAFVTYPGIWEFKFFKPFNYVKGILQNFCCFMFESVEWHKTYLKEKQVVIILVTFLFCM